MPVNKVPNRNKPEFDLYSTYIAEVIIRNTPPIKRKASFKNQLPYSLLTNSKCAIIKVRYNNSRIVTENSAVVALFTPSFI
jgi:hypothetical protein